MIIVKWEEPGISALVAEKKAGCLRCVSFKVCCDVLAFRFRMCAQFSYYSSWVLNAALLVEDRVELPLAIHLFASGRG